MSKLKFTKLLFALLLIAMIFNVGFAQKEDKNVERKQDNRVRPMTIPISIFTKKERKEKQYQEFVEAGDLTVKEANDER